HRPILYSARPLVTSLTDSRVGSPHHLTAVPQPSSTSTRPRAKGRFMKAVRALVVLVLVLLVSPSCSAPPTAPATPEASLIGSLLGPTGLLKCSNLPYDSSTVTIGPLGGTISAGPHWLTIPAGAVLSPTAITMTAPTGQGVNAVKFKPAGLHFVTPAVLSMSY